MVDDSGHDPIAYGREPGPCGIAVGDWVRISDLGIVGIVRAVREGDPNPIVIEANGEIYRRAPGEVLEVKRMPE